jgi:hypothetical protein
MWIYWLSSFEWHHSMHVLDHLLTTFPQRQNNVAHMDIHCDVCFQWNINSLATTVASWWTPSFSCTPLPSYCLLTGGNVTTRSLCYTAASLLLPSAFLQLSCYCLTCFASSLWVIWSRALNLPYTSFSKHLYQPKWFLYCSCTAVLLCTWLLCAIKELHFDVYKSAHATRVLIHGCKLMNSYCSSGTDESHTLYCV